MYSNLPISINRLLREDGVEGSRIELKSGWKPDVMGYEVLRTICAFANDIEGMNGGYMILGVAEKDGHAVLPPAGLTSIEIDNAQKWIAGKCKERIHGSVFPRFSVERVGDKKILVVWIQASDDRPHYFVDEQKSTKREIYFIRIGNETIDAKKHSRLNELMNVTKIPFDRKKTIDASTNDISESRVRAFLRDTESELAREIDPEIIYQKLGIVKKSNSHYAPINAGLLFFSNDPEKWFKGARIEVTQFSPSDLGSTMEEKVFRGPLNIQISECLSYLQNLTLTHTEK